MGCGKCQNYRLAITVTVSFMMVIWYCRVCHFHNVRTRTYGNLWFNMNDLLLRCHVKDFMKVTWQYSSVLLL